MAYEGEKELLLEKPGKKWGDDGDDEDFSSLDQSVKSHQDFSWETPKTSTSSDKLKEILKEREKQQDEAFRIIKKDSLSLIQKKLFAKMNDFKQVVVRLDRNKGKWFSLFINNEINEDLPEAIIRSLGPSKEEFEMTHLTPKTSTGRETFRPKKMGSSENTTIKIIYW